MPAGTVRDHLTRRAGGRRRRIPADRECDRAGFRAEFAPYDGMCAVRADDEPRVQVVDLHRPAPDREAADPTPDEVRTGRPRGLDEAMVEHRPRDDPGRSGQLTIDADLTAVQHEPAYRGPVVEDPGDADAREQVEYVRRDAVTTRLVPRELVPIQ